MALFKETILTMKRAFSVFLGMVKTLPTPPFGNCGRWAKLRWTT